MNIYLDVDGVLLANDQQPAKHADEFIKYVVTNYPTYWLTTHCRQQENYVVPLLNRFFSETTMKLIKQIEPTYWHTLKTEVLDFDQPFLWFDDDPLEVEKRILKENNALDNWIEVDLSKDVDALKGFIDNFPD